ncbi:MAG: PilZ domain-containing protein [Candidatus Omnitrophica bacterium]|nr:PilZ domain-containing protein [Candidatus Omnitrophota bacterium]
MTKRAKVERRQHPRIEQKLPVNVAANGYGFATETKNISCLGAYCHIDKYIPPFTKVAVKLKLPVMRNASERDSDVECKGVVVRTEDETKGGFNIAIFFNEIRDAQRNKISRYISQFLPQEPRDPSR